MEKKRSIGALLMHKYSYYIGFLLYCIVSWLTFFFTSGGWGCAFYICYVGPFYLILILIFLLSFALSKKKSLTIHKKGLWLVFSTQALAILFNYGDNGDGYGNYVFFERILGINGPGIAKYQSLRNSVLVQVYHPCFLSFIC